MRRMLLILAAALLAGRAYAVAPQFWRVQTADDFLAGDINGFSVTSRGHLQTGPTAKKIASFTDPFVLSQAASPNGDHFFGTGNDGKVYRLRGTELKAIYTAPEPEIYAVAFHDGALYAGTSPNGKVYRVDPESGKATVFYDPKQAYIWALQFVGSDLVVATGVEGKLFRVSANGQGKEWFDSPEVHLRSIAARPNGTLLVGGSAKGRIYSVAQDGSAHALYDSAMNEISSIYVDANGVGWAAGVANQLPATAPAKPQQAKPAQQGSATAQSSADTAKKDETATAAATAEVSFSFDDSSSASAQQVGAGELYRINTDDFVETVRKFEHEMVYAISGAPNGSIMLATGPQGRIYTYSNGEAALIANVPEKQVVSIDASPSGQLVTTTNAGAVYRLESTPPANAEFRSAAKDVERFSRFGHYRIDGPNVANGAVAIAFRSGNTRTPDATWSSWSKPVAASDGDIAAPPGRYVQWRLTTPKPVANLDVDSVTVAFINRNVAPAIDAVTVQDPAVVFISSAYPTAPQVVEATNPDEYGIFSSLDSARDKASDPGKKMFRKGFRTVTWRAHDDNGDTLRYSLAFRAKGTDRWLRLRDNIEETQFNWDTSQLPDGAYELRLTATDAQDNPEMPLTESKEGIGFQVDNTPPVIAAVTAGNETTVRVTDSRSPVGRVEYSIDAQKWMRMTPVDGIADSPDESYKLPKGDLSGRYVIIRATDAFYNVATQSIRVP